MSPKCLEIVKTRRRPFQKGVIIVFTDEDIRHLVAKFGADHIVAGTDYGTSWNRDAVDRILAAPDLSDADRIAILGGTAAKLVKISSTV